MKSLASIVILLTAIMQPAFAERGKHGDHSERRDHHMNSMLEDLKLTSEQEPVVRQILEEQHDKLRSEMQSIHEQMKPKMEALKAETEQRLSTVLNEEQLQTFMAKMEKRHDKMRDRKSRWHNRGSEDSDH